MGEGGGVHGGGVEVYMGEGVGVHGEGVEVCMGRVEVSMGRGCVHGRGWRCAWRRGKNVHVGYV